MVGIAAFGQPALAHGHGWLDGAARTVGEARFSWFFFDIYDAQLMSPNGGYDGTPPYALKLTYRRDVESTTIVETSLDEMRRQGRDDAGRLAAWGQWMRAHFPDMNKGDEAVMVALADGGMMLLYNGRERGRNADPAFTAALFDIWLSDQALKPDLSRRLRGLRVE